MPELFAPVTEIKLEISKSYMDLYELLTGRTFDLGTEDVNQRIRKNLKSVGYSF